MSYQRWIASYGGDHERAAKDAYEVSETYQKAHARALDEIARLERDNKDLRCEVVGYRGG